jgi:UDPglucose 6-dehydrogenase
MDCQNVMDLSGVEQRLFDDGDDGATMRTHRVGVVGGGYMGACHAAGLAEMQHDVWVCEAEPARLAALRAGQVPFFEPGLGDMLSANAVEGRLHFVSRMEELLERARIVFICVGTPAATDGSPDLGALNRAVQQIITVRRRQEQEGAQGRLIVVIKSTVPVGTARRFKVLVAQAKANIQVISSPEFLAEGTAVRDTISPHKLVVGGDDPGAVEAVVSLYGASVEPARVFRRTNSEAEASKLFNNATLASRVAVANEFANFCATHELDYDNVASVAAADPRIGSSFLCAGPGYGGSCFGKDVENVLCSARMLDLHMPVLAAVLRSNHSQKQLLGNALKDYFGSLFGKLIAIAGGAFKYGTDDTRESASIALIESVIAAGGSCRVFDPVPSTLAQIRAQFSSGGVACVEKLETLCSNADALCVMFGELAPQVDLSVVAHEMRTPLLVDPRRAFDPLDVQSAAFDYIAIGRPPIRR